MRRLGISVYPNDKNIEEVIQYIETAGRYGFKRIFSCLISAEGSQEDIQNSFGRVVRAANANGMEMVADVSPEIFEKFQISYKDLSFFKALGLYGLRLDLGFSGQEEAVMSFNPYDLKIELNMSNGTKYLDNILSYKGNASNIIGCHNFYPHQYTGLSREHFLKCSHQFRALGIRTAAFVSSHEADHGPWPVNEGLPTLESHRHLPIEVQVKDLWHTGLIDDCIIGNAYASEKELKRLSQLNKDLLELQVIFSEQTTEIERKIILEEPHFNRGDVSDYMIRSTQSRVKYKGHDFVPHDTDPIEKGDVLIESQLYTRYAGELQIAKKPMVNSGKTNRVARIIESEHQLLEHIEPWQHFKFIEYKG